jgi:hypothetical protein
LDIRAGETIDSTGCALPAQQVINGYRYGYTTENLRDDIAAMGNPAYPGDGLVIVEQGMLDATWADW